MATLYGTSGIDTIGGTASADTIYAGGGDTVYGGAGNDVIFISGGNQNLMTVVMEGDGDGELTVNDAFAGDITAHCNTIYSGGGDDSLIGGGDKSYIEAGNGNDIARGDHAHQNRNYLLYGGGDTVLGEEGNDTLEGHIGNDTLLGGTGADTLFGGNGIDTMRGDLGSDTLFGGAGNDRFVWTRKESGDAIHGFLSGDRLDLSGIDANEGVGGNQAFTWVGSAPLTSAGQIHFRVQNGNTLVEALTNSTAGIDHSIMLMGYTGALSTTDFVF